MLNTPKKLMNMKAKLLTIFILFIFLNINKSIAQTILNPGDIAVLGLNCDDSYPNQRWAFVPLVNLAFGTVIHFTDAGFDGSLSENKFYVNTGNEGHMTWTVPSNITAGTTFIVTNNSGSTATITDILSNPYSGVSGSIGGSSFGFLQTGDQIIVYKGTSGTTVGATFIYALNNGQSATNYPTNGLWMTSGTISGQQFSYLPDGLTNGTSAVGLTCNDLSGGGTTYGYDNMKYNGTTTGTKVSLLAAIGNPSNWSGDNTSTYLFSSIGNFTISVPTVAPTVTTQAASSINTTTATGNGSITATGGANATNRGVIWYAYSNTDKIIGDAGVTNVSETGSYGVATFTASLTGLAVNTRYNARAHATNSAGTSYGSRVDFWTLSNVPAAPTVNNATSTSLDVAINVNSNPTGTEFAIQETSGNMYVQANGTLGASAVWQTNSNWGTKTVTGLTSATSYTFKVKARNGANTETSFSTTTSLSTKTPGLWTGATSTNWHTTTNWDDGVVPTATTNVTIPNVVNKPVIGANAICNNITIQNGSQLTINATFSLEVKGNLILNTGSGFTNNGVLKFSGTDCHLTDNRSTKVTLGNIVTDN